MSPIKLRLARVGHLLWLMKFRNPQLIESAVHRTAIMRELLLHMKHSSLTTVQFHVLMHFCALSHSDVRAGDFHQIAFELEEEQKLVLTEEQARAQFNDAITLLGASRSLRQALELISLAGTVDQNGQLEPHIINSEFPVELNEFEVVDGFGRREVLRNVLDGLQYRRVESYLGDVAQVKKIDKVLLGVCGKMTEDVQFVVRRLYGLGIAKVGEVGVIQELRWPYERVVGQREAALRVLGGPVRNGLADVLGQQSTVAAQLRSL